MSTYSTTTYTLYCNGRTPYGNEGKDMGCYLKFEPPQDDEPHIPKPAELRKLAAKAGWTYVRSEHGRRYDMDYCPDHKPEGT